MYINYDKDKPTVDTKLVLDISKAKELFDWSPKLSLAAGIKDTVEWYRGNSE